MHIYIIIFITRLIGQRYFHQYNEVMPCEQLVSHLCDIKQAYTQYGGKRPFGVSLLYMGWDKQLGYQLYQSDPSGRLLFASICIFPILVDFCELTTSLRFLMACVFFFYHQATTPAGRRPALATTPLPPSHS